MKIKICIVTTVHSFFDTRIFHKEAKTLVQAGYKVTLIAQHDKNEVVDDIKIIALPKPKNRFFRILFLGWKAYKLALRQNADIYHFHDPELIFIGILLKLFGKRVIYDVHEDVPKQILNKEWMGNVDIRKIAAFITNMIEQIGTFFFIRIIAATTDIAKRFPENKTVILRNFPILKLIDNTMPINYKKNKPVIIYAGGLTKVRGIKEIVQAMDYIGERAELWLLGKWENEEFRYECENLKGWDNTRYLGFISLNGVFHYMKITDIGFCLLYPIKNYITGLPVKAFEYMACSLPIIMSDFYYRQKIFGKCALFAKPYDPEDIAEKVFYLLDNPDIMKNMGKEGRKLVADKYSWEMESKKLLDIYKTL